MKDKKISTPKTLSVCDCGKAMTSEDSEFWGECESCRTRLPIHTSNDGDGSGAATDRAYNGGMGHSGEW